MVGKGLFLLSVPSLTWFISALCPLGFEIRRTLSGLFSHLPLLPARDALEILVIIVHGLKWPQIEPGANVAEVCISAS